MSTASLLERLGQAIRAVTLAPLRPMPVALRDPNITALLSDPPATSSGVAVTEASALRFPPVWAAVQCIAGDVASLPFFHYRRRPDGGKERYSDSKLYKVLHDEMNPEMSAMVGRETLTSHVLLWGNGYAEILRNDLGQVVALYPIEPSRVMPERSESGAIVYRVLKGDGTEVRVAAERILHLVGLGFNGLMGYSPIAMMRESLGAGLAAERLGGQVMQRGAKYSGFFEHPRTLGATAHANLKQSMATDLPGTYRILEEGMTYKAGSMPLRDAQFIELKKFSVTDVARIFGIPPHKLGDLERATFSNVESQQLDYVISTLRRWLVRWEQECNRKLIAPLEKRQQFCEHLVDGLLRGDIQSRYTAYSQGINNGFLSSNDIRGFENLDPIDGGDTYLVQGAMVPLARLNDLVDAQVRPPPAPIPPEPDEDDDDDEDDDEEADDAAEEARMARVVGKIVEDLRAEVIRRTEALATLPAAVVAALPPVPAEPDISPEDEEARMVRVVGTIVEDLRAEVVRRTEALATLPAAVVAALPPAPESGPTVDWREATFALVAGKLVRRELAQLRKREADPTAAAARLEAFYRRFVGDALAELRPWLGRLPEPERAEAAAAHVIAVWADEAMQTCVAALQQGGLGDVIRRWAIDRDAELTRALMEAIDG
jgi:HK97 family phage portal protein